MGTYGWTHASKSGKREPENVFRSASGHGHSVGAGRTENGTTPLTENKPKLKTKKNLILKAEAPK